ncbi:MAG TPA: SUMF1/EgtB/PvdO family nonheme iron enzyme [Anaerolineales bacterium]|nr:SUMF1/EgtB/PvdO family nonheme iron enzyme [Anaerolineales bacterium]
MAETKPPKVFISYAWEDDLKTWVLDFAARLRSDGINAILDQWETVPGDQLPEFMEKSVRESDFVVFVCTPTYKRKSDRRKGGVGYEGHIITGEVFQKNNHRKFIPVLRKGKWATASPSWASSKLFIDFRGEPYSETSYQHLLDTLFGKSPTAPPLRDDILREKEERETAEKIAQEKVAREKAEKGVAESAQLEVEEQAKIIVARENAERERIVREEREKQEREAAEKTEQEKVRREVDKAVKDVQRQLERKLFFMRLRHKINRLSFYLRYYIFPAILVLGIIAGTFYVAKPYFDNALPLIENEVGITPQPSLTTIQTDVPSTVAFETATPYHLLTEITDAKGVSMVLVPAGEFIMGSDADVAYAECQKSRSDCQGNWFVDEEPQHTIYLNDYYIDKYEVTNFFYARCVALGVCDQPGDNNSDYGNTNFDNFPVVYADWYMAKTFCEWRESHLPTEAQWEKAARGIDSRNYPWGEGIDCTKANYWGDDVACIRNLTEVGKYDLGRSPYGLYDMTGNVWEWVNSLYQPYPYNPRIKFGFGSEDLESSSNRVLRGGGMNYELGYDARISNRLSKAPDFVSDIVGFRCAKDAIP